MRGIRVAVIVGPILIAINHWDTLLYGQVTAVIVIKMILTPAHPILCFRLLQCQHDNPAPES